MPSRAAGSRPAFRSPAKRSRIHSARSSLDLGARVSSGEEAHLAGQERDAHGRARRRRAGRQRQRELVRRAVDEEGLVAGNHARAAAQAPAGPASFEAAVRGERVVRVVLPRCERRRGRRRTGKAETGRSRSGAHRHRNRTADETENDDRSHAPDKRIRCHRFTPWIAAVAFPAPTLSTTLFSTSPVGVI